MRSHPQKNHGLTRRLTYATRGIAATFRNESSFRTQCLAALAIFIFLAITRPEPLWWAIVAIIVGSILAAELFNTALENLLDVVHSDFHPLIGTAKDCAAAAVLVLSGAAILVFTALLIHIFV